MSGETERGSQAPQIRTAIHNIREPDIEFQEPLPNVGSCSVEFSHGEGCANAVIGAS